MNSKLDFAKLLSKLTKQKREDILKLIEIPPNKDLGDFAFPCFSLSKVLKKDPKSIAIELEGKIKLPKISLIKKILATGPYLNAYLNEEKLNELTLKEIWLKKDKYGYKTSNKKVIVVEYPSPNTNKPLHLGHLRNLSLGESVSRLLFTQGNKIFKVNLNNDRGIHICKSMLAYQKWGNNKQPNKKSDHFVGDFYVMFSKKAKEDKTLEEEAQKMLVAWEKNDPKIRVLWKKMNGWALDGFNQTYKRFRVKFDKVYYESQTYKKGRQIVEQGLKNKLFSKDETGAVIYDLGEPLGKKVLLRADGTTVYITQDLYLAQLKYQDFKYHKSIYVVANEQNYHFNVLFEILKKLKFKSANGCYHLNYGMVNLPEGRMKSREGTVVDADDLIDELKELVKQEMKSRKLPQEDKISEKIGLAAIKYFILNHSPHKDFIFNPQESISLEGDTGPYLLYSLVRAKKILKKIKIIPTLKIKFNLLNTSDEILLIKKLNEFPLILERASESYDPHLLTEYAFKLASLFSNFYEKCPVMNIKDKDLQKARITLVKSYSQVISSSLNLLGIEPVDEM